MLYYLEALHLNRAATLWPCKFLDVIGLYGFLYVEFVTSSSVICHVFRYD